MYLLVGELLNTSREAVKQAVTGRNAAFIQDLVRAQVEGGVQYLDVNCGNLGPGEVEAMEWLVTIVRQTSDLALCIDSPNPQALEVGLALAASPTPMVNSITAEKKRYNEVLPLVLKYRAKIVALCLNDQGIPKNLEERLRVATWLVENLRQAGLDDDDIYLDPLVKPLSISDRHGVETLEFIRLLKETFPSVHLICGLSNISYGLPSRRLLNRAFLVQTMAYGADAFILDPTDKELLRLFYASVALLGRDRYCSQYVKAFRSGLLNG